MPACATLYALVSSSLALERPGRERAVAPPKLGCREFGLSNPVSRLKNVVLPAPFGPISAVMAPRCISRCSTSTATSCRRIVRATLSTDEDRLGFATARAPARRPRASPAAPRDRSHTPRTAGASWCQSPKLSSFLFPRMPCGRKITSSISPTPTTIHPNCGICCLRHDRRGHELRDSRPAGTIMTMKYERQYRASARGPSPRRRAGCTCRAGTSSAVEGVRLHGGRSTYSTPPMRTDHATEDQRLHLVQVHVLAEAAGRVLVLADAADRAAPRAAHERQDEQAGPAAR